MVLASLNFRLSMLEPVKHRVVLNGPSLVDYATQNPKSPCPEYRFYTILPPSISNRSLPERHS